MPRWLGDTNFMTSVAAVRVLPEALGDSWAKLRAAWDVSGVAPGRSGRAAVGLGGVLAWKRTRVVVRLSGWRRRPRHRSAELRFPLGVDRRASSTTRSPVRTCAAGSASWRKHGQGFWRLGIYHGLDGWSFWSIGLGRNAVLIECSGERFRYVVVEVADPGRDGPRDPAAAAAPRDRARSPAARGGTDRATGIGAGRARRGRTPEPPARQD